MLVLRIFIVIITVLISYFQVSNNIKGIIIGLLAGSIIVLIEFLVEKIPLDTLLAGGIGIIIGYIFGYFIEYGIITLQFDKLTDLIAKYSLFFKLCFALLGLMIAINKKKEVDLLDKNILSSNKFTERVKIIDTSVIIDGRIADICETKFLTGPFVIPEFILNELQRLADSSDVKKRIRARRGMEILKKMQDNPEITIKIYNKDYPEIKETDTKLLQLAKDFHAVLLTTDFNLNKIASLQDITVLNINDLANSLKPIYLPGETLSVYVVKEGKEYDQGVGYLDDGTMVVVEDARRLIGRKIEVVVTSMLQTSAGRLIFTRPK